MLGMTLTTELMVAAVAGLVTAIVSLSSGYVILIRLLNKERESFRKEAQEWSRQLIVCKDDLEEAKETNRKFREYIERLKNNEQSS